MKKKRNTIVTTLTLIITLTLMLSTTAIALADTADQSTTYRSGGFVQVIKEKLDNLVTAGTITQDQETAIQTALTPSSDGTTSQRHDFTQGIKEKLDGLVSAGTITQDQANAIQTALTPSGNGTGTHQATKGIVLRIGQSKMTVNGTSQDIDPGYQTAPVIIKDRTFIPIRAIVESLGGTVDWSASDQKITITVNLLKLIY
jgi:hypothetical protein